MLKKYTFTGEKHPNHLRLRRIVALRDFGDVKEGDAGGWIEDELNLSHKGVCWVYDNAGVCDRSRVWGDAWIMGEAMLYHDVKVCDCAQVCERARLYNNVRVYGDARVWGNVMLFDNVHVYGIAKVCGDTQMRGDTRLYQRDPSTLYVAQDARFKD